jgi:hypothetical protein
MTDLDREIRSCVDSFVIELSSLVRKAALESVQQALGGAPAPARRGRPPAKAKAAPAAAGRKTSGRGKRGRRSSALVNKMTEAALAYVSANPGCSVSEIGAALETSTKELRLPLMKLMADGKLHTKGEKRGTRYHGGKRRGPAPRKKAGRKKKAGRRAKK